MYVCLWHHSNFHQSSLHANPVFDRLASSKKCISYGITTSVNKTDLCPVIIFLSHLWLDVVLNVWICDVMFSCQLPVISPQYVEVYGGTAALSLIWKYSDRLDELTGRRGRRKMVKLHCNFTCNKSNTVMREGLIGQNQWKYLWWTAGTRCINAYSQKTMHVPFLTLKRPSCCTLFFYNGSICPKGRISTSSYLLPWICIKIGALFRWKTSCCSIFLNAPHKLTAITQSYHLN